MRYLIKNSGPTQTLNDCNNLGELDKLEKFNEIFYLLGQQRMKQQQQQEHTIHTSLSYKLFTLQGKKAAITHIYK